MKKKIFLITLFFSPLFGFSMKEQLQKGKCGDFIVSERDKRKELLRIHTIENDRVILEEIALPSTLKVSGIEEW